MRTLIASLALIACSAGAAEAQLPRAPVWPPGYKTQLSLDTLSSPTDINASWGKTFRVIVAVFDELKIPLDTRDSTRGVIGNMSLTRNRTLAGAQMSRWFNCGTGITGPNADNFRIYLALAALMDRGGADVTKVRIGFVGGAQDVQGNAKEALPCASTGALEARMLDMIKRGVSAP